MDDLTNDPQAPRHEWGEAVPAGTAPKPGDIIVDQDTTIAAEPLVGADVSTPLEEDESDTTIPPSPLWAMKDRRHTQWHLLASSDRHERIRLSVGDGDDALFAIDDGRHHAMIGRRIGSSPSGVEYCLIGRVTVATLEGLESDPGARSAAFDEATELLVCGIDEEPDIESSNVLDVARYDDVSEVPPEYLPGSPYQNFRSDLEITAY